MSTDLKEIKKSLKEVIGLLQLFHDNLERRPAEPDVLCSHCGQVFDTLSGVMTHGRACTKNPLVRKVQRLQTALRDLYNDCRNESCDAQRGAVMEKARKALEDK